MAQQLINIGTVANDGTGDTLRVAGDKINDNFTEVYNQKTAIADLASTAVSKGASLVGVQDVGGYFTGATVEAVLQEIGSTYATDSDVSSASTADRARSNHTGTQLSTTISDFAEAAQDAVGLAFSNGTSDGASVTYVDGSAALNVANTDKGSTAVTTHVGLADPHTQYALESELSSNLTNDGASMIGIEDINGYYTATTVEGALQEVISTFDERAQDAVGAAFTAGTSDGASVTYVDGSNTFNVANTDKGSSQNIFKNIAVATQNTIVADSNNDTLTVVNGTGITVTTDDTTDSLTITNSDTGSSAVSTHVGLADPHTQYAQESILASTSNGQGASLIGIEDADGLYTATTVEAALDEVATRVLYEQINSQTAATYTLVAGDTEKVIELGDGTGVTLNLPDNLSVGFTCTVVQYGAGQVTFTVNGGAVLRNRQSHTKTAGQWAVTKLYITTNAGGNTATYILSGDTAA